MVDLKVKIYADGADIDNMRALNDDDMVKGLTTNPSLMKKAGVKDYTAFCKSVLNFVTKKPISFEVFADEFEDIERQAREIAKWGDNVFVKIPVTNTRGETSYDTIEKLSKDGVKINATAVFTFEQIDSLVQALDKNTASNISIFAGRIADSGRDPLEYVKYGVDRTKESDLCEIIWASTRQVYNIIEANNVDCHIITVTPDMIGKVSKIGFDLNEFSLETVKMFYEDAQKVGYTI